MSTRSSAGSARGKKEAAKVQGFLLTVVDGQAAGREYHFETDASVGRTEDNAVIMVDPGISRNHAKIYGKRGVYLVEDLGSSNGTRPNGEKVEGIEVLRDGDYIGVGQATLQFSNLDLVRAGDPTARIRLTEKQRQKLDQKGASVQSPKEALQKLLKSPRGKLILVGGGLAFLLLTAGVLKQCKGGKKAGPQGVQDFSETPVEYDDYQARGYASWAFGYGQYNQNYRDKVSFRYLKPPQKLRLTLEFAAWGIDDSEEVVIQVNGKRVGTVPTTRAIHLQGHTTYEYEYGIRLELDTKLMKTGENFVTFDNTKNSPNAGSDLWEVAYVKLRETAIPSPDLTKAKECFFNAKNNYDQRNVDPANMQKAIQNYECARDYLEEMAKRPDEYQVAIKEIEKINRELSRIFKTAIFDAQRDFRYQRYDEAAQRLKQAMMYFQANPRDSRFIQLKQVLDQLGG